MLLVLLCLMLACPLAAFICHFIWIKNPSQAARYAGYSIGVGIIVGLCLAFNAYYAKDTFFYASMALNTLTSLLSCLVLWVSFVVHRFSLRYMDGDRLYRRFFMLLSALSLSALLMVLSDDLFLFWATWSLSNLFLVSMMIHKKEWSASKNAGLLALYSLGLGSLCLLIAVIGLNINFGERSILTLSSSLNTDSLYLLPASVGLILITALIQSGLFPFHRWLLSSLNSPTPVSAFMHAGLVNGGGILLVKFAGLMVLYPYLLTLLFVLGALSAMLGTVWKLMQVDIKKMLACSTMAQMGFMIMQCSLGLFAAAIAHLCWHGLFKAYLFLSSGSAVAQQKTIIEDTSFSLRLLIVSLIGGAIAMQTFASGTAKSISLVEPSTFVLLFAFIAGAQCSLTWVRRNKSPLNAIFALILVSVYGLMYGTSVHLVETLIPSLTVGLMPALTLMHWAIMILFAALWLAFNFGAFKTIGKSKFGCWLYINLFNASQPAKKTVTALRQDYNY